MTEKIRPSEQAEVDKRPIGVKTLKLMDPRTVYRLYGGDFAESPVFVSPKVRGGPCDDCGVVYRPLVYKMGEVTKAHHYHKEEGGIYYDDAFGDVESRLKIHKLLLAGWDENGWVANVKPTTTLISNSNVNGYKRNRPTRTPSVSVEEVFAFCQCPSCSIKELPDHMLNEGLLFFERNHRILPVRKDDVEDFLRFKGTSGSFQLRFRKTPRGISFSSI